MATILGLRDTDNFTTAERTQDWRHTINRLYPRSEQKAPLNALLVGMKKEKTTDPRVNWFEKSNPARFTAVNYSTGYASTVTTLAVDSSIMFRAGDLVRNASTDEVMKVASDPSATTSVVVTRGWGSTAAAVGDNEELFVVGTAIAEGASVRSSLYTDPSTAYNYTQIFRYPLNLTNTAKATKQRTGPAYAEMKREALDQHTVDLERAMIWGVRNEDTTGDEPIRSMGGIVSYLSTNVTACGSSTLTAAIWDTFLKDLFAYGAGEKLCFCGNHTLMILQTMAYARGQLNMQSGADALGIKVTKWVTPFGTLYIKNHPLFNEVTTHSKSALFIEPKRITYRPLNNNGENRDTKFLKDRQARGADKTTDEFLTECTIEVHNEKTMGLLTAVNAYS